MTKGNELKNAYYKINVPRETITRCQGTQITNHILSIDFSN